MNQSPKIEQFEWGVITLADGTTFRDAKLYPGGAREWDWGETSTRHIPGIQPTDVIELLDHGASVIVLSKGVHERLQTMPQTLALLDEKNVKYYTPPLKIEVRQPQVQQ
jgi:hypothetical protein